MTQEVKPQDHPDFIGGWVWTKLESRWIEERIAEAILAEREACAKVCDEASDKALSLQSGRQYDLGSIILRHHAVAHQSDAAVIRARGQA